jgi:hypothetical protein
MKPEFLKLTEERRKEIIDQVSYSTSLPTNAIEKDWWVTQTLKAISLLKHSGKMVFKGGTSLSKGWGIINRFSEDIDIALDQSLFGISKNPSKKQITKLRVKAGEYISADFLDEIKVKFSDSGINDEISIKLVEAGSDTDPRIIEIMYDPLFQQSDYLKPAVKIEIGVRSLIEPNEMRVMNSIISSEMNNKISLEEPFSFATVRPEKTFLEKIFLLHEEFKKEKEKIRTDRLSRHLYDLEKMMDTVYGKNAISDISLYKSIVEHRETFNKLSYLEYPVHSPQEIIIIPPSEIMSAWENDYKIMRESLIQGDSIEFDELISRITTLQERVRNIQL